MEKESSHDLRRVRSAAAQLLFDIMEKGAYANLALDKALKRSPLPAAQKNLLTEIVNGTVRMVKHLDWVLNLFLKSPLQQQNPWLKSSLRISLYQLMFMDRIADYACVNDAVSIAEERTNRSLGKVCNGVLRNIIRNRDMIEYPPAGSPEYLAVYYSHPEWMIELFMESFGYENSRQLLEHNNRRPHMVFRANPLKGNREELVRRLEEEGVECRASRFTPWGIKIASAEKSIPDMNAYRQGRFYVQNEGSMLAAAILNPPAGEFVLDLCSGVGGKTTHLAEYMHNRGKVRAYDYYQQKIALLQQNCLRLGINMVEAFPNDILSLDDYSIKARFILLDAPCSGLGVLNRRADARWRKKPEEMDGLAELQSKLLTKAGTFLEQGGRLLFSTCTINHRENEEVVAKFLGDNPEYKLQGFADNLAFCPLDSKDKKAAAEGMLTLMPGKYDTDGMFYALMGRI